MTEIYLYFLFAHYGLYGNAPVVTLSLSQACVAAESPDVFVIWRKGWGGWRADDAADTGVGAAT